MSRPRGRGLRRGVLLIAVVLAAQVTPTLAQTPAAPRILWLTVTPSSLDYAVGGPVTVTMGVESDAPVVVGSIELVGPSGFDSTERYHEGFILAEVGVQPDGTRVLSSTETFGPWREHGTWSVDRISVYAGSTWLDLVNPAQIAAYPLATPTLELTGVLDMDPPQFTAIEFSPASVLWSTGGAVEVTIHASDDVSGIELAAVTVSQTASFGTTAFVTAQRSVVVDQSHLIGGSETSGTWRGQIEVPPHALPGTWSVYRLHLLDRYGRWVTFEWPHLEGVAIPLPTFEVLDDQDPTDITSFAVTPEWFAVGAGGTVQVDLAFNDDGGTGFQDASIGFLGPEYGFFSVSGFSLTSGDTFGGTARAFGTLPEDAEAGAWRVTYVYVRDESSTEQIEVPLAEFEEAGIPLPVITVDDGSGRPSVPRAVVVSPGEPGEIEVSWLPPAYQGATPIIYDIAFRVAGGVHHGTSTVQEDGPNTDIVGGSMVDIESYPWQGALVLASQLDAEDWQFCGASLIAARWVVTAAHCVDELAPGDIHVAFGKSRLSEVRLADRVPVDAIVVHPGWDEAEVNHDIALLHLAGRPAAGHTIAISADEAGPVEGSVVTASGWGNTASAAPQYGGYFPNQLRAAGLTVLASPGDSACGLWGDIYDPATHLCAGSPNSEFRGPCIGDSGGPLSLWGGTGNSMELVGITSFGAAPESGDCGYPLLPSVFTRVSAHAEWIGSWVDNASWSPLGSQSHEGLSVDGLEPGFKYEFRITARNDLGSSPPHQARGYTGGSVPPFPWPARLAGANRFATAAAIAEAAFPEEVETVFVATGYGFADALTGAAVAGLLQSPLLLVGPTSIPSETRAQLERLSPETIVILGGTSVVSGVVETQLGEIATTLRLSGNNRFTTAVAISQHGFPDGADEVVIASGFGFADALAGAPAAARLGGPVLLTGSSQLPAEVVAEIQRLAPTRIVVLGGASVVSTAVVDQLESLAPDVVRLFGPNRYSTAIAINGAVFPGASTAYLATGLNFPDALTAAAAAAASGSPMYLVSGSTIPAGLVAALTDMGVSRLVIAGGTAVIGDQVPLVLGPLFYPH